MRRFLHILIAFTLLFGSSYDLCAQKRKAAPAKTTKTTKSAPKSQQKNANRSSDAVKKDRQETNRKINQTKAQIEENKRRTRQQLDQFNAISADVDRNRAAISKLQAQLATTNGRIKTVSDSIDTLSNRIATLKQSAARSLRNQRTMRQSMSSLSMIFSSDNFNQAVKRAGYIKQLDKWRASKARAIKQNIAILDQKKATLDTLKSQQAQMLAQLSVQQADLDINLAESQRLVNSLKKQGKSLEDELKHRNQQLRRLDQELERVIAEEARIAAEKERQRIAAEKRRQEEEKRRLEEEKRLAQQKQADKGSQDAKKEPSKPTAPKNEAKADQTKPKPTPASQPNVSLAQMRGKLPSPISGSAKVVGRFGRSKHEDLSKVEVDNPGIDIQGQPGAKALAVHPGTVSSIFYLDGYHNIVMVRHGEYLTVYANIDALSVKKGDEVKAGQALGSVFCDKSNGNRTILHFEVRLERQKFDPLQWINL